MKAVWDVPYSRPTQIHRRTQWFVRDNFTADVLGNSIENVFEIFFFFYPAIIHECTVHVSSSIGTYSYLFPICHVKMCYINVREREYLLHRKTSISFEINTYSVTPFIRKSFDTQN